MHHTDADDSIANNVRNNDHMDNDDDDANMYNNVHNNDHMHNEDDDNMYNNVQRQGAIIL